MKSRVILAACGEEVLQPLTANLKAAGRRIQCASSGLDLLHKARQRLPDLIILDSTLPDMDGDTVCEILRLLPSTASIPRILLAAPMAAFTMQPLAEGLSGDCPMPRYDIGEIARRIDELLGNPGSIPAETFENEVLDRRLLDTVF